MLIDFLGTEPQVKSPENELQRIQHILAVYRCQYSSYVSLFHAKPGNGIAIHPIGKLDEMVGHMLTETRQG